MTPKEIKHFLAEEANNAREQDVLDKTYSYEREFAFKDTLRYIEKLEHNHMDAIQQACSALDDLWDFARSTVCGLPMFDILNKISDIEKPLREIVDKDET